MAPDDDESRLLGRLSALDRPTRPLRWTEVVAEGERRRRAGWRPVAMVAAALVCVSVLGYAAAGFRPVRQLARSIVASLGAAPAHDASPHAPAAPADSAGIRVPVEDRFVIAFTAPAPGASARVRITAGEQLEVSTPDPRVTFNSQPHALRIDAHGAPAGFEIRVPAGAPWIEIQVAGRTVFRKRGSGVVLATRAPDGSWPVSLAAP